MAALLSPLWENGLGLKVHLHGEPVRFAAGASLMAECRVAQSMTCHGLRRGEDIRGRQRSGVIHRPPPLAAHAAVRPFVARLEVAEVPVVPQTRDFDVGLGNVAVVTCDRLPLALALHPGFGVPPAELPRAFAFLHRPTS